MRYFNRNTLTLVEEKDLINFAKSFSDNKILELEENILNIDEDIYLSIINKKDDEIIICLNNKVLVIKNNVITKEQLLNNHKQTALSKTDAFHSNIVQQLVGNPTQVEKDTWSVKLQTAQAVLANETLSPFSQSFLLSAGYNTEDKQKAWAQSVINKATNYTLVIGLAEKIRDFTKEGIKAATTIEQVDLVLNQAKEKADEAVKAIMTKA